MIQYGEFEHKADEGADREPARELARGMAAHAISDDHDVVHFLCPFGHVASRQAGAQRLVHSRHPGHAELILVVLTQETGMRERADVDLHERREGLERPERRISVVTG